MINVLFCGNSGVFDGALTTMLSIFKRTETREPFHFFILTMGVSHLRSDYTPLSDAQIAFLADVAKSYNPENIVEKIDVTALYKAEFGGSPNEDCYCSPYTLLRLFADLIPQIPEKILYLDIDLLFNRDITLLYDMDISDYEYAAAPDHYGKLILFFLPRFINAGVMLFNMKKCRETGLFKKSRELIKTKKLVFADESALVRSTSRQLKISQRFNDQKFLYKKTVIRHFSKRLFWLPYPHTANIKQWRVTKIHKVFGYENFDDILYEYIYLKKKFEKDSAR
ncbi:glycosyltransferase [Treponema sp.]|uniref:glycosyltransferase n=1 Tax=Treponema sp. TaxID=166 RepID=UPI0025CFE2FB|nr:glycosyltransferase [Treponema sp.]MBR4323303.1 lipopolysaccharide biosynthesis protein [Treponema sp.]